MKQTGKNSDKSKDNTPVQNQANSSQDNAQTTQTKTSKVDLSKPELTIGESVETATPSATTVVTKLEKKPSQAPAVIAIVIALASLGASGYLFWQSTLKQQQDASSLAMLKQELTNAAEKTALTVKQSGTELDKKASDIRAELTTQQSQVQTLVNNAKSQLDGAQSLQTKLVDQVQRLEANQSRSRKDWLLAEAEYLVRLANQNVLMEQSVSGALPLLKSADAILAEIDDATIFNVRKALASDIAKLDSVPKVDVTGVYTRLDALIHQAETLRSLNLMDKHELPSLLEEMAEDEVEPSVMAKIKASWARAMDKLDQLVVIQHHDEEIEPLMAPEQNFYLQQNVRMMLEQAELALLRKEQVIYETSLAKAEEWLSTYYRNDDPVASSMLRTIAELKGIKVNPPLPEVITAVNALSDYMTKVNRLKQEGAAG
jgi:uroporphyrin-3 C-methyltransferase